MSININTVKSLVELVVNKDQSGLWTPARFNLACESVNIQLFNDYYGQPVLSKDGKQINDVYYQSTERITNNLRPFITPIILQIDQTGKAIRPTDYVQTSSVRYQYGDKQVELQEVNDGDLGEYLGGDLLTPTKQYPIFCNYSDRLQFYPKDLSRVFFTYLRKPVTPVWGFTVVNNRPVYDPATSTDFDYTSENLNEIVIRIVKLYGISIREAELNAFAQNQENKGG